MVRRKTNPIICNVPRFRLNFDRELVKEESCEKNLLLRDPSRSSLDAYVHTHARTDVPTYRIAPTHTHMHAGTHE